MSERRLQPSLRCFKSRHSAQLRRGDANRLEQVAHATGAARQQSGKCDLDVGRLPVRSAGFQCRRAALDTESKKQIALPYRAMNARAHGFRALRQRLEVDMRRQIGGAWRAQWIGKGMPRDRLERVAQAGMAWP